MKLGSWLSIVAVLTCGFSAIAETTEDYAAQADLVACWDGVENAGKSGQHVDSLPDNEWRDTIGNVPFAMHGITVENNCIVFGGTTSSYGELSVTGNANPFNSSATMGTLEIVYHAGSTSTANQMLLQGNTTAGIAIGTYNNTAQFICWTGSDKKKYFNRPPASSWSSGTNTIAVTYANSIPQGLYFNSVSGDLAVDLQNWGSPGSSIFLGKRYNNNNMNFAGSIYAVRLYRRVLTTEEIAHNREIDTKRFIQGEVKGGERLQITSTSQVCNPSLPEYGVYNELTDGQEVTITIADSEAQGLRSDAVCRGWKLYRRNQAKEWVLEDEGASLAYTYRHAAGAQAKLEWQWEETAVYGTRRYVQDGLVACWDGAENGGVSGGHLDALSEWKDTLNDIAFTLTGGLTVTADGLDFPGVTTARGELSEASATATFDTCKNGTLEIVLTPAASAVSAASSQLALCGSKDSGMAVGFYKKANPSVNYLITTYGSTDSPTIPYTVDDWTVPCQTVSVLYNNARSTSPGYLSGEAKASAEDNSWDSFQSAKAVLGGRFNNSATTYQSPYAGKIHAIRIYDRQLSPVEIAANRAVDEDRFVKGNLAIGYQADFRVVSVLKNSFAVAGQLLTARSAVKVFCRVRKTGEAPGEYMLLDDHWTVDEPLTKEYAELETGVEYTIDFKVEDPVTATCLTRTLTATPTARYPADCSVAGTLMADGSFLYVFDQVGTGELVMPPSGGMLEYLVVGGGGAGGSAVVNAERAGGGGGGGGLATGTEMLAGGTRIQVTVGAGGVPSLVADDSARNGGDSAIAYETTQIIGLGGGAGGNNNGESGYAGGNGGGAGNGGEAGGVATQEGGFDGIKSGTNNGGGGGGAGGSPSGTAATANNLDGRPGGDGRVVAITGEEVYYAGGGGSGGANGTNGEASYGGVGGKGGGGSGGLSGRIAPMAGTDGLGGGGGGASKTGLGGRGGSGVVILHVTPNVSAGGTNPYAVIESVRVRKDVPSVTIVGVLYAAGGEEATADMSLVWGTSPDALTEEVELSGVSEGRFEMTIDGLVPESEIYFALKASNAQGGAYEGLVRKATVAGPMSEPTLVITEQRGAVSYAVGVEDPGIGTGGVVLRWGTDPNLLDHEMVLGALVPGVVFSQAGMVEVPDHQSVWFVAEAHSTADGKSWTKTTPAVQTGVWTLEGQLLKKDGWVFNVTISEDALTIVWPIRAIGRDLWPDFSDPIVDAEGNGYRVVNIQKAGASGIPFFKGVELIGFTAPDMEELGYNVLAEQPEMDCPLNFPKLTMIGSNVFLGNTKLKSVKLGSSKVAKLVFGSIGSQFDGQSDLMITFRSRVEVEPTAGGNPQTFAGRPVFKSAGKPYILKVQRLEYLESWAGLSGFTAVENFTDSDRAFVAATIAASEHKVRNCPVLGIYQDKSHTAQNPQRHLVIGPGVGTCLMLK